MDEEAVSPVIGVILMVAVVVVLAAAAFVLVSDVGSDEPAEPASFYGQRDDTRDEWKIIIGTKTPQDQLTFAGSGPGIRYAWNTTATAASPALTTTPIPMVGSEPWAAGAFLSLCAEGASPVADYVVTFVDVPNNRVVVSTQFTSIAPCA